jgi:hypothetical protein
MKLKDMKLGIRYVVTTPGSTLAVGDQVEKQKDLLWVKSCGWLMQGEWHRLRNEVAVDLTYYKDRVKKARKDLIEATRISVAHRLSTVDDE